MSTQLTERPPDTTVPAAEADRASSGSIGVGFAIPIDDAKQVINQLMSGASGL